MRPTNLPSRFGRSLSLHRSFPSPRPVTRRRWMREGLLIALLLAVASAGAMGLAWCMLAVAEGRL